MLWIRIQLFNADPDPGSQTNADPCRPRSWSQQLNFYMLNILKVGTGNRSRNLHTKVNKAFWNAVKPGTILVNLVNFHAPGSGSAFPIRIHIQDSQMNADLCGSGSTTLKKRDLKDRPPEGLLYLVWFCTGSLEERRIRLWIRQLQCWGQPRVGSGRTLPFESVSAKNRTPIKDFNTGFRIRICIYLALLDSDPVTMKLKKVQFLERWQTQIRIETTTDPKHKGCRSASPLMRIRIQLFTSVQIRN